MRAIFSFIKVTIEIVKKQQQTNKKMSPSNQQINNFVQSRNKRRSSSNNKAGVFFPVEHIHRKLKTHTQIDRVSKKAAVYLAATFDYLIAEIMDAAGYTSACNKKKRISSRHISVAIYNDEELCQIFQKVILREGGVRPKCIQKQNISVCKF